MMRPTENSSILILPKFPGSERLVEMRPVRRSLKRAIKGYIRVGLKAGTVLPHVPLVMQVWTIVRRMGTMI
ncbi:MAG: hypothetical protein HZA04_08405 [Nitrospinae bacterium]|nr:hypothetical protein [Nitrospinota bacterium]